jgi:predicted porin
MIRLGRGLTPFQEVVGSFEPWHGLPSQAGFYTDISIAGFNSTPLDLGSNGTSTGQSNNRFSNAIFYNSPVLSGFQVNAAWASKEAPGGTLTGIGQGAASYTAVNNVAPEATVNPFSVAATYNNGPAAAMLAYERNAVESKVWSIAGSFAVTPELKLMGTYSRQSQEHTNTQRPTIKGAVLGATYAMGPGKVLAGFGIKQQEENVRLHDLFTRQYSLGYEYSLSKRTYVYIDASRKKNIVSQSTGNLAATPTVNHFDVGVNHSF